METLYNAIMTVTDDTEYPLPSNVTTTLISEMLRRKSWCPTERAFKYSSVAIFASMCGRSYKSPMAHERCTLRLGNICREADIETNHHCTRHVSETCHCESVAAATDADVRLIIEHGMLPLYAISNASTGRRIYRTNVEERDQLAEGSARYVAFSHVWADGLGNPTANTIPLWQFRKLQKQVNALFTDDKKTDFCVPFFLDTLSVPVIDPCAEENDLKVRARKRALALMSKVYQDADCVLVIDRDLEMSCSTETNITELAFRLQASRWSHRLWTLHEALSHRFVLIQLSNGVIDIDLILQRLLKQLVKGLPWDPVTRCLTGRIMPFIRLRT